MPSALVLAGGRSSRYGSPKAAVPIDGVPMLARVAAAARAVCDEVLVVGGDAAYAELAEGRHVREDASTGPLGGIAAGLGAATHDTCVVLACDMPFVRPAVLRALLDARGRADAVVPRDAGRPQPLHAVWTRGCLDTIAAAIAGGTRAVTGVLPLLDVCWFDEDEWRPLDPEGRSWWNVNTPEDLPATLDRRTPLEG